MATDADDQDAAARDVRRLFAVQRAAWSRRVAAYEILGAGSAEYRAAVAAWVTAYAAWKAAWAAYFRRWHYH
jgi:hypothetical protein